VDNKFLLPSNVDLTFVVIWKISGGYGISPQVKMEAYYRCQMARSKALAFSQRPKEAAANVTPEKTFKFAEKPLEEKNVLSKPCAGHLCQ
jgi:hypothetical protein